MNFFESLNLKPQLYTTVTEDMPADTNVVMNIKVVTAFNKQDHSRGNVMVVINDAYTVPLDEAPVAVHLFAEFVPVEDLLNAGIVVGLTDKVMRNPKDGKSMGLIDMGDEFSSTPFCHDTYIRELVLYAFGGMLTGQLHTIERDLEEHTDFFEKCDKPMLDYEYIVEAKLWELTAETACSMMDCKRTQPRGIHKLSNLELTQVYDYADSLLGGSHGHTIN